MTAIHQKSKSDFRHLVPVGKYAFLFIILLFSNIDVLQARQVNSADSLLLILEQQSSDSLRADMMLKIALEKYYTNTAEAIEFGKRALSIYEKIDNSQGIGRCCNLIGACYFSINDYLQAKNYFGKSYAYAYKTSDSLYLSRSMNNLGNVYLKTGDLDKATECFIDAIAIYKLTNNIAGALGVNNNIGEVYRSIGNYRKALEYYNESLKLALQNKNQIELSAVYHNISAVYTEMEEYHKALEACEKSYEIRLKNDFKSGMIKNLISFGNIFQLKNEKEKALKYYNEGLMLSRDLGYSDDEATILMHLGYLQLSGKNFNIAREYFAQSLELAEKLENSETCIEVYQYLYYVDSVAGDFESAFSNLSKYHLLREKQNQFDPDKKIAELENKYNLAKSEVNIQSAALKQKQSLLIFMAFGMLLLFFSAIIGIQYIRLRAKKRMSRLMQDNLRSQMNPHFIFNVLNSINAFILQNDKETSSKYLLKFARLLRLVLDNARSNLVSIHDEIETLRLYLELEAMRLNNKLEYEIFIDEEIDPYMFKIPTLLLQPYVENSILHGIQNKVDGGRVEIRLDYIKDSIHCTIYDNGIGMKKAQEMKVDKDTTHKSYGATITETRLKLLNSFYGRKMGVKYTDIVNNNSNGGGTKVEFDLPIMN